LKNVNFHSSEIVEQSDENMVSRANISEGEKTTMLEAKKLNR